MPQGRVRRTPRTTLQLVSLFRAIAACEDIVQDWELTRERAGVRIRVASREAFGDQLDAERAAKMMLERVLEDGQTLRDEPLVQARTADWSGDLWRGHVEIALHWV